MTFVLFFGIVLASYRITRFITKDLLIAKPRHWFFKRFPPNAGYSQLVNKPVSKLGELMLCSWCIGTDISGGVVFLMAHLTSMRFPVLWWLATGSAVGLIANRLDSNGS